MVQNRITREIGIIAKDEMGDCIESEVLVQFPKEDSLIRVPKIALELLK